MQGFIQIIKSKSFISLLGSGLGALLGVINFAILARVLDIEIFGPYLIFLAIYGIFETLRIGMVMNALVRNLAQCKTIEDEQEVIGSTQFITLFLTFIYIVVITLLYFVFKYFGFFTEYLFFFKWFVLIAVISAPNNYVSWYLNAKLKIASMSTIRILNQLVFIGLICFYVKADGSIYSVIISYTFSHLVVSIMAVILGWSGLQYLLKYTLLKITEVFHFVKFSMGTLLGSNLLRRTDTFIIGSSFLGSAGVAVYNVPSRLLEIIVMPLRSFANYMAILPLDKFSGVLLDTINRPNFNFSKVMIQLAVNVEGDYIGIAIFGNLKSVAFISTATFLAGMAFGYYQPNKHMGIKFNNVLRYGWQEVEIRSLNIIK
ncbi:MAG: oligosaccharide flippase family protein [Bacteroidia bacterium]